MFYYGDYCIKRFLLNIQFYNNQFRAEHSNTTSNISIVFALYLYKTVQNVDEIHVTPFPSLQFYKKIWDCVELYSTLSFGVEVPSLNKKVRNHIELPLCTNC